MELHTDADAMIRNYFTIGWRTLIRGGGYSVINLLGLTVGMAAAMLIGIWILYELNYNRSFQNYDRLAQLYHHVTFGNAKNHYFLNSGY